jgi:Protein of unknown function (DUF3365)
LLVLLGEDDMPAQGGPPVGRRGRVLATLALAVGALLLAAAAPSSAATDEEIALSLAAMLQSARAVVGANQDLINDPAAVDKGLTGEAVLETAIDNYIQATGTDPRSLDPESREGRLLRAQMEAIREVVDEHQETINRPGVGFKGFVPAVFGRLVNERFAEKVGDEARVKVTAPLELVRNRKARPDAWEAKIIETRLKTPEWPQGRAIATRTVADGREQYRVLVPEYYSAGCLSCHGEPRGEIDVTGYPKEGGELGDLGGAISVTLFR